MAEVMGADWKPQNQKKKGKKGKKGVKGQKEDDEVKFPASRGSRREFPATEKEYRKGQQLQEEQEEEEK